MYYPFVAICEEFFLSEGGISAAATAAATTLGECCKEFGILFHDQLKLFALGNKIVTEESQLIIGWVWHCTCCRVLCHIFAYRRKRFLQAFNV
jgi:hypothetical protein